MNDEGERKLNDKEVIFFKVTQLEINVWMLKQIHSFLHLISHRKWNIFQDFSTSFIFILFTISLSHKSKNESRRNCGRTQRKMLSSWE